MEPRPKRKPDVICRAAGQETLLYDSATDSVHVLNATARMVWELCDGCHTAAGSEAVTDRQTVIALLTNAGDGPRVRDWCLRLACDHPAPEDA